MKKNLLHQQFRIAISGISGTTMMTLYSYIVSSKKEKDFKEPKLLGKLAHRLMPWMGRTWRTITGWGMHYIVGLLFAEMYAPFWSPQPGASNLKTGLIVGGFSGIAAILIWKFSFDAHPFPPAVHFTRFAGLLFIAHLVFGIFAAIGYDNSIRTG